MKMTTCKRMKEFMMNKKKKKKKKRKKNHMKMRMKTLQDQTQTPSRWVQKNHPETQIIGDKDPEVKTIRKLFYDEGKALLSTVEPKTFKEA